MPDSSTSADFFQVQFAKAWAQRGWLAWLLLPFAMLFFCLLVVRRAGYRLGFFKTWQPPVPVIVVGNIFVGGTGKTPLVIWLISALRARGFAPGVISRGYGGKASTVMEVGAEMAASDCGDEPLLIAQKSSVPVFIGRDRVAAARALLAAHPGVDVIVSDDGLQHYALGRTIEIQLSDMRGHGNGWLLPAGPLREPASRKSDFHVVHGAAPPVGTVYGMQLSGSHAEQLLDRRQCVALSALSAKRVAAVAGIGHPERFFDMLRAQGVCLDSTRGLPDHFDFSSNPFTDLVADIILITEKDAVKCVRTAGIAHDARLWIVPVETHITGPLAEHILEKLRG